MDSCDWGFVELEIDTAECLNGRLSLLSWRAVFPGPARKIVSHEDVQFAPFDLASVPGGSTIGVSYNEEFAHGTEPYRLVTAPKKSAEFIPLARTTENRVSLDPMYIPPITRIKTSAVLIRRLDRLLRLAEERKNTIGCHDNDTRGETLTSRQLTFITLARWIPMLSHLMDLPTVHPERLYEALASMAAELAAIAQQRNDTNSLPRYEHTDLTSIFDAVFARLEQSLSTYYSMNVTQLPVEAVGQGAFVIRGGVKFERPVSRFILGVKADLSPDALDSELLHRAKIAAVERMGHIVSTALPGIPIKPIARAPRNIPEKQGFAYYEMNSSSPEWKALAGSKGLGIQVSGGLAELAIEMWAIREQSADHARTAESSGWDSGQSYPPVSNQSEAAEGPTAEQDPWEAIPQVDWAQPIHRSVQAAASPSGRVGLERVAQNQSGDIVEMSAFSPPRGAAGREIIVQIFLHAIDQAEIARMLSLEVDNTAQRRGIATLVAPLLRGQRIDITLEAPGLDIDEPVQKLSWNGEPRGCQFIVRFPTTATGQQFTVCARMFAQDIPIGTLKFHLTGVSGTSAESQIAEAQGSSARKYNRAFLSYASPDRREVLKRAQALSAARISFFQDILNVEPGERWERRMYREIDECDLFLLFWSKHAAASTWVTKEAAYALDRWKRSGESQPDIMPVILEGPPIVPPPAMLADLHFNDPLSFMIAATAEKGPSGNPC